MVTPIDGKAEDHGRWFDSVRHSLPSNRTSSETNIHSHLQLDFPLRMLHFQRGDSDSTKRETEVKRETDIYIYIE
jgi:hypothetical protein